MIGILRRENPFPRSANGAISQGVDDEGVGEGQKGVRAKTLRKIILSIASVGPLSCDFFSSLFALASSSPSAEPANQRPGTAQQSPHTTTHAPYNTTGTKVQALPRARGARKNAQGKRRTEEGRSVRSAPNQMGGRGLLMTCEREGTRDKKERPSWGIKLALDQRVIFGGFPFGFFLDPFMSFTSVATLPAHNINPNSAPTHPQVYDS